MQPVKKDIVITTGDTFRLAFRLYTRDRTTGVITYTNLTGYTGRAVMRRHEDDDTELLVFTVTPDADQTTNRGLVRVTASAATTAAITEPGVWACALTSPGGEKDTWVRGMVSVAKGIAR